MSPETSAKWELFRQTGLLWWINMILHTFGYAIYVVIDDDNNIIDVYPDRCSFRGFGEKNNTKGYIAVTNYLVNNVNELVEDVKGDENG